jgi:hypothetical protein
VHILLRTTKACALKDVLCLEKIFIKHAENIKNARARCTVFDSDEEPQ